MKLLEGFADMEKQNKAVSDALVVEEVEYKKKKIVQDEVSCVLNLRILFKHPIHPIPPSEILMAASSSENTNTVDSNTASSLYELMELLEGKPELIEGDARIQDVLVNSDVGNPEVEVKAVGDAISIQIDEFGSQQELQNGVSENMEKFFCSQASAHGIEMARNFCAISSEFYTTEEAWQGEGASMSEPLAQPNYEEEDQEQSAKDVSGSATATTTSQLQTPNAKSRKQEWKNMQASGPSSPSLGVLNSVESFNEAGGSLSPPSREAAVPQRTAMHDLVKQLCDEEREYLQKLRAKAATVLDRIKKEEAEKKNKIAKDEVSSVLNLPIMFKHPIPGDARIQDVLVNSDVGNPEVEVKVVGDARSTQIEEFGCQQELQNAVSEDTKFFCSQASDLGIVMARNFPAISSEICITEEARQDDGASMSEPLAQLHYVEEDQEQSAKDESGSATATTTSQLQTPNAKSRKQEWKIMQISGPSSPSLGVLNSVESFNEAGGSLSPPSREAAVPRRTAMHDLVKQLCDEEKEYLQKLRARAATVLDRIKKEEAEKKKKIAKDEVSSVLNLPIMFKRPIHGDARIQDVLVNSDVGNPEVEVKVVGDARCTQIEEFGCQQELQNAVSEDKKFFCSQASDLGIVMARNFPAISSEFCITEEAWQGDGASMSEPLAQLHYVEEDQEQSAKDESGLATATTTLQLQTPNAKSRKQEWKIMQISGPSSLSLGVLNSVESFNEAGGSLSPPSREAAVPQRTAMHDLVKQLCNEEREYLQKLRARAATVLDRIKREEAEKKKKIAKDEVSSVLNLPIMFKRPIHGDARIQDVLVNSDVGNPEVEVKVVGDARSTQIEEFGCQQELQNAVSEDKKFFCSQASDLGIVMSRNFPAISSEICITEEARQGDGASMSEPLAQLHYVEEDQEQSAKDVSGSATATTTSQLQTPNAKSRKQEWKNMQASGPSSPSLGVFNSVESFNEAGGSLSPPSREAAVPQRTAMHDLVKQLCNEEREYLQKLRARAATVLDRTKKEEAEKKKKIAKDEVSSVLNLPIMFKCPIHGDARIQDVLVNSDVGNPEVEVKVVGDARSTQIEEFGCQQELQNAVSEDKKFFCSQASDLGIVMSRNFPAISSEFCITEEARQGDGASMSEPLAQLHYVEEDQEKSAKDVSGSATATTTSQLQTPNAKSRKQEWKNMQASGPSSPSLGVLNSVESFNEAGGSLSPPSREAAVPQRTAMHDLVKQLCDKEREYLQKLRARAATVSDRMKDEEAEKKKKIAKDEVSGVLNPRIMFKHPTHPITPSEILMGASPSESTSTWAANGTGGGKPDRTA